MIFFDYILVVLAGLYFLQMMFLRRGLDLTDRYIPNHHYEPSVAIIVAARNEEENIYSCLESLEKLEYPRDKTEIIVVDDGSTDRTAEIADEFVRSDGRFRLIRAEPGKDHLRGKANALAQGIKQSKSEILFFTDADCIVPTGWIRGIVPYHGKEIGVVAGFTLLTARRAFEGMQALDWFFLFGAAASTAGWGIPLTAVGNNLSTSRTAYEGVGGFRGLPFSVTEDYTLVQSIWQKLKQEVRYVISLETLVTSKPCTTVRDLFRQKQRWGVGGLDMVPRGFLLMGIHFALHLALFVGIISGLFGAVAFAAAVKIVADLIFLWKPLNRFRAYHLLKHFFLFELYYSVYELVLPFVALLSKRVIWKERSLRAE